MNAETTETLLNILASLMASQSDLVIKVTAAERILQKYSPDQFQAYKREIAPVKAHTDMTPQMLAIEKLRNDLLKA